MKRVLVLLISLLLVFTLFSCDNNEEGGNEVKDLEVEVLDLSGEVGKTLTFSRLVESVEDLEKLDLTDEYQAASGIIFSLLMYETNPKVSKEMFEYINGPEDMSDFDINFIENQIEQYPYVMRSYLNGAEPGNDYKVESVSITIKENIYSRDEEGYVKLWLHSGGADSDRAVTLRKKASTGEWFLFSDTYKGLMAGIRIPQSEDKWN